MFLTEEQLDARLKSESNLANRFSRPDSSGSTQQPQEEVKVPEVIEKQIPHIGRTTISIPIPVRTEIAIRARLGERQETLAQEFGTCQENVSNIKNGKIQGVNEAEVSETISKVRDKALDRLMTSLGLLTDDKLSGCSAKDLSVIASNMGRVVEKTLPKSEAPDRVMLVVYTPEIKPEKNYNSVEV